MNHNQILLNRIFILAITAIFVGGGGWVVRTVQSHEVEIARHGDELKTQCQKLDEVRTDIKDMRGDIKDVLREVRKVTH